MQKSKNVTYKVRYLDNGYKTRFTSKNPLTVVQKADIYDEIDMLDEHGHYITNDFNSFDLALALHVVAIVNEHDEYELDKKLELRVSPMGIDLDHEENEYIKQIAEALAGEEITGTIY
jgi:hypothetical protein